MTSQDDLARPWFQPSVPPTSQPDPGPQQRPARGGRPTTGPMTTRVAGELSLDEQVSAPAPRPPGRDAAPERVEVTQPYIPAISDQAPGFAKRPPSPGSGPRQNPAPNSPAPGSSAPASSASSTVSGALDGGAGAGSGSRAEIDVGYGPRAKEPIERLPLMSELAAADPAAPEAPGAQDALTRPGDFASTAGGPGGTQFAPAPAQPPVDPTAPQPAATPQPAAARPAERTQPAKPPKKRSLARRVVRRIIGPDLLRKDPPKNKG